MYRWCGKASPKYHTTTWLIHIILRYGRRPVFSAIAVSPIESHEHAGVSKKGLEGDAYDGEEKRHRDETLHLQERPGVLMARYTTVSTY